MRVYVCDRGCHGEQHRYLSVFDLPLPSPSSPIPPLSLEGARVILAGKDADVAGVPSERLCSIQVTLHVRA